MSFYSAFAQSQFIPYRKGDKWGYCNYKKEIIIPCKYDSVGFFYDCYRAIVEVDRKYGYIDTTGRIVIPIEFDSTAAFFGSDAHNCKVMVRKHGVDVWLDNNGNFIPLQRISIQICCGGTCNFNDDPDNVGDEILVNGKAGLLTKANKRNQLDLIGDTLLKPIYDNIRMVGGDFLLAELNGKWGIIAVPQFKTVLPFEYDQLVFRGDKSII